MIEASFEAVVPKAINAEFEAIIPREKAFDIVNKDIHIDANGRYEVKADAGTAMTQVNVEVDVNPYNAVIEYADKTIFGPKSYKSVEIKEGVKEIDRYALYYATNIESITVPSSIESWGDLVFAYSGVKRLELKDGLKVLGVRMCYNCTQLEELTIPNEVKVIPERAFTYCAKLKSVVLPSNLEEINSYAFSNVASNIQYYIPLETWLNVTVKDANLQSVYGNKNIHCGTSEKYIYGMSTIKDNYMRGIADIKKVVLSDEVKSIGAEGFSYSGLEDINLQGVTTISSSAFRNSNLIAVDISSAVEIGDRAFVYCNELSSPIKFNKGLATLNEHTFGQNNKVPYYDFSLHESIPTLVNSNTFYFKNISVKIVVPDNLYDQWIIATNWATYASRIVKASEFVEPTNN